MLQSVDKDQPPGSIDLISSSKSCNNYIVQNSWPGCHMVAHTSDLVATTSPDKIYKGTSSNGLPDYVRLERVLLCPKPVCTQHGHKESLLLHACACHSPPCVAICEKDSYRLICSPLQLVPAEDGELRPYRGGLGPGKANHVYGDSQSTGR
jgi:hypothetical protein